MKINLLLNNDAVLNSYLNIDPFTSAGAKLKVFGVFHNLNQHVEDGECEEIRAVNIIDYYSLHAHQTLIPHWVKKLAHGGVIIIGFVEASEVARAICNGMFSFEEMNHLLHGEAKSEWQIIKSSSTLQYVCQTLESFGLHILTKRVVNYQGIVKAQRQ